MKESLLLAVFVRHGNKQYEINRKEVFSHSDQKIPACHSRYRTVLSEQEDSDARLNQRLRYRPFQFDPHLTLIYIIRGFYVGKSDFF